jgi:hypothetical protein
MKNGFVAFAAGCVLSVTALAAEPQPTSAAEPSAATQRSGSSGSTARRRWEALLQEPAKLDFGARQRVTVREVLHELNVVHGMSFRFDTPTLGMMFAGSPLGAVSQSGPVAGDAYLPNRIRSLANRQSNSAGDGDFRRSRPQGRIAFVADDGLPAETLFRAASPTVQTPTQPPVPVPVALPAVDSSSPNLQSANLPDGTSPAAADTDPRALPEVLPQPRAEAETPKPETKKFDVHEYQTAVLNAELQIETLDLSRISIETLLRHTLDAIPSMSVGEFGGMPVLYTKAQLLDFLIEDHGLLITTKMQALVQKETRVYSVRHLDDIPPEQLAKLIRQTVRPWSWRSLISDLGDQLKGTPLPPETIAAILKSGVQLAGGEIGLSVTPTEATESAPAASTKTEETRQMAMVGNALANGLVTFAQATLSALEMTHYAEPPTGTIQVLGSRLVITQSQSAHREIADLLRQLAEDE